MMKHYFKKTAIALLAVLFVAATYGQEEIIYSTGFESDEDFTHATVYNNTTIKYDGPAGEQWGTYYGTASTTGAISGDQSMQMRWYTSAPGNLGYTFTDFDLHNVTKVTFLASSTSGINVTAYYSTDGGVTFIGEETFDLSGTPTTYTYDISATGEFENVRIMFEISLPSPQPGGTSRLYIDDVEVYGVEDLPEPGDPAITVSETSLYNFGSVYVDSLSNVQFYYVSALDLVSDLTITAPDDFLVSLDCTNDFESSVIISPTMGDISETRVFVRFKPAATGNFSGNISHSATDAATRNIAVSGSGTNSQIPAGYYNTATGTEDILLTQLHQIIRNHNTASYASIWSHFENTDQKYNGKVWDIYSDIQCEEPPYEYVFFDDQQGADPLPDEEGHVYNREHSWPRSWWGGSETDTMFTDIHHIYPADRWVNMQRSNYVFGTVNNPTWTSESGHKLGNNSYGTTFTGIAFEPIDEYKGDLARTMFYMVTRYQSRLDEWATYNNVEDLLDGSKYPAFEPWALEMLIEWHENDPVSQKEIDRNNEIYAIQGNRNPFIDNPGFVNQIWGEPEEPEPHEYLIFEDIQSWNSELYGDHTQVIQVGEGTGTVTMTDCRVDPTGSASETGTMGFVQMRANLPSILELPEVPSVSYIELNISAFAEDRSIQLQMKDGEDWTTVATISDIGEQGVSFNHSVNIDAPVTFRLTNPSNPVKVHDIIVAEYEDPSQVATPVISPDGGTFYSAVDVEITTNTPNTTLYYSTNSETGPWNIYTGIITISSNTTLWAYAEDNNEVLEGSNVANAVFTFHPITEISDIATLRLQDDDETTLYKLTGEVFLTFQQDWRNQKFIQDETAGILIDDPGSGEITTAYNIYDGITGITGTLSTYNNMLQLTPISDPGPSTSQENEILPVVLNVPEFTNDFMDYQAMLVTLFNIDFLVEPETTFSVGTVYNLSDGVNQCDFRTTFFDADYIGSNIPLETVSITGIANSRDTGNFITARSSNDFGEYLLMGDINNDGVVNILDLVWLINYLNGIVQDGFNYYAADVNNDGVVNVADVSKLISIILEMDS